MTEITYEMIIDNMMETEINAHRFEIGSNNEILCRTEEDAECIADFLEAVLGIEDVCTSSSDDFDGYKWDVHLNGM